MKTHYTVLFEEGMMMAYKTPQKYLYCRRYNDGEGLCDEKCYFEGSALKTCLVEQIEAARAAALPVSSDSIEEMKYLLWQVMGQHPWEEFKKWDLANSIDQTKSYDIIAEMREEVRETNEVRFSDGGGWHVKVLILIN